jgi:hypothetical protein
VDLQDNLKPDILVMLEESNFFRVCLCYEFQRQRRMLSSGMLCCVALVRTNISEEHSASIMRVTRIGELGTLVVTSNRCTLRRNITHQLLVTANIHSSPILVTLMMEARHSSATSVTWRNFPEGSILHSHHRENPSNLTFQRQSSFSAFVMTLHGNMQ